MRKEARFSKLPKAVQEGIKKSVTAPGEKPFLLAPFNWLAGKAVGKDKVDDFYWKFVSGPTAKADIALGSAAQKGLDKIKPGKKPGKFFTEKKVLETGKRKGLETGGQEYDIPSITAPAAKAGKVVIPLLGAVKLDEIIQKQRMKERQRKEKRLPYKRQQFQRKRVPAMSNNNEISRAELQKTAEMLTYLKDQKNKLEKEAKATELLFKQAEMGQIKFPNTHAEYQEKVAELLSKDLSVVEEAIKMASSTEETNSFGGLEEDQMKVTNARESFEMAIID